MCSLCSIILLYLVWCVGVSSLLVEELMFGSLLFWVEVSGMVKVRVNVVESSRGCK